MAERVHVVPGENGGWNIVPEPAGDGERPANSVPFVRKRDAENSAKELVRDAGGGVVVVHTRSGRIKDADTEVPSPAGRA